MSRRSVLDGRLPAAGATAGSVAVSGRSGGPCPGWRVGGEVHERFVAGQVRGRHGGDGVLAQGDAGGTGDLGDAGVQLDGHAGQFGRESGDLESQVHDLVGVVVSGWRVADDVESTLDRVNAFGQVP